MQVVWEQTAEMSLLVEVAGVVARGRVGRLLIKHGVSIDRCRAETVARNPDTPVRHRARVGNKRVADQVHERPIGKVPRQFHWVEFVRTIARVKQP